MLRFFSLTFVSAAVLQGTAAFASPPPAEILDSLADESFQIREQAQNALALWVKANREDSVRELIEVIRTVEDPEVGTRCLSILRSLAEEAYLKEEGAKGYLGVSIGPVAIPLGDQDRFGVLVLRADPGSPAATAGIKAGDVIIQVNEVVFSDQGAADTTLIATVGGVKPLEVAKVTVLRGDENLDFEVMVGRRPAGAEMRRFDDNRLPAEIEKEDRDRFFEKWLLENRPSE
jgi:C-terminal processing protease CtpA/Prc